MVSKKKYDGIIEAVHYNPDGKIEWVRAYERHGFVFSDRFLLDRDDLVERLKNGEKIFVGQRKTYWGNDFELEQAVRLVTRDGDELVVAGQGEGKVDHLEGVPIA